MRAEPHGPVARNYLAGGFVSFALSRRAAVDNRTSMAALHAATLRSTRTEQGRRGRVGPSGDPGKCEDDGSVTTTSVILILSAVVGGSAVLAWALIRLVL